PAISVAASGISFAIPRMPFSSALNSRSEASTVLRTPANADSKSIAAFADAVPTATIGTAAARAARAASPNLARIVEVAPPARVNAFSKLRVSPMNSTISFRRAKNSPPSQSVSSRLLGELLQPGFHRGDLPRVQAAHLVWSYAE